MELTKMYKIPALTKLYVWSVILEPLLFFGVPMFGLEPGLSRILQTVFLIVFLIKLLCGATIPRVHYYKGYVLWFVIALLGLLIGIQQGLYSLNFGSADTSNIGIVTFRTAMGPLTASLLEYLIVVYYFVYFVVFPQVFLRTQAEIAYFLRCFMHAFLACLIIGFIDFALTYNDIYVIGKGIGTTTNVGNRFHGLAGEPRHAFAFLLLGLAVIYLKSYYEGVKGKAIYFVAIIVALVLTRSFSGVVGIALFLVLSVVYFTFYGSIFVKLRFLLFGLVVGAALYSVAYYDERVSTYTELVPSLWSSLETTGELPWPFSVQGRTIYPLHDISVKIREFNLFPVLFGSGFGASSIISNVYENSSYLILNPSSQAVRLLYETGIVGLFVFIWAFIGPVKKITKRMRVKDERIFIVLSLLMLSTGLSQRHVAMYIFFGIFYAAVIEMRKRSQL